MKSLVSRLSQALLIITAVTSVLFLSSCELINPPEPSPDPSDPIPSEPPGSPGGDQIPDYMVNPVSCSFSNNEHELEMASPEELRMACLIIENTEQQRAELHYHPYLRDLSREIAEEAAECEDYDEEDLIFFSQESGASSREPRDTKHTLCYPKSNSLEALSGEVGVEQEDLYFPTVLGIKIVSTYPKFRIEEGFDPVQESFNAWYNTPSYHDYITGKDGSEGLVAYYGVGYAIKDEHDSKGELIQRNHVFSVNIAVPTDESEED